MVPPETVMVRVIANGVNRLFGVPEIDLGVVGEPDEVRSRDSAMSLERDREPRRRVSKKPLEGADFEERSKADFSESAVKDGLLRALPNGLGGTRTELGDTLTEASAAQDDFEELTVSFALLGVETEFFEEVVLHPIETPGGGDRVQKAEVLPRREVSPRDRLEERVVLGSRRTAREKGIDLGCGDEDLDLFPVRCFDRFTQSHRGIVSPDEFHRKQNAAASRNLDTFER